MRTCNAVKSKRGSADGVYLVESIVAERFVKSQKFYKVRWEGFSPEEDSWEPEENLSNVRNLITRFHQRKKLSKSSADSSNSSSSSSSTSFKAKRSVCATVNGTISSHQTPKRHVLKPRCGKFEYVPQNELVASKTKYFDDIRDGKIDLSSNDLYSRVKTRRRCIADNCGHSANEDDSLNRSCSFTDYLTPSRHSAPSSPKNLARSTDGSVDDCASAVSDPTMLEASNTNLNRIPDLFFGKHQTSQSSSAALYIVRKRRKKIKPNSPRYSRTAAAVAAAVQRRRRQQIHRSRFTKRYRTKQYCVTRLFKRTCDGVSELIANKSLKKAETKELKVEKILDETPGCPRNKPSPYLKPAVSVVGSVEVEDSQSTLNDVEQEECTAKTLIYFSDDVVLPQQTVPSSSALIASYLEFYCASGDHLAEKNLSTFPALEPVDKDLKITSRDDLVSAIVRQQWSLLATHSFEELLKAPPNLDDVAQFNQPTKLQVSQHPLVAAIIGGEGKPFIMQRLLNCGFDANFVDPISGWPVLVIAAYFGRIHAVRVLLEAKGQPNASVKIGGRFKTALGIAIMQGNVDMVNLLILNGANLYKVEENTTALKLIMQFISGNASPYCLPSNKSQTYNCVNLVTVVNGTGECDANSDSYIGKNIDTKELKKRLSSYSLDPIAFPPLQPPEGVILPNSPYNHFFPSAASTAATAPTPFVALDGSKQLPTTAIIRIYQLITCHHARLSTAITAVVRTWLTSVGLTQVSLVMPCQWINTREDSFSLSFAMPRCFHRPNGGNLADICVPILLLVHGVITPPGCYHVWMEDDGPCLVDTVFLGDVEQKPLGRQPFAVTLFPFETSKNAHSVTVRLKALDAQQPHLNSETCTNICIASIVIVAKPIHI